MDSTKLNDGAVLIVMGPTGSGKSTFINTASNSTETTVGNQLQSCTSDVHPVYFQFGGHLVTLVDTPGFDDTTMPDTEVLRIISNFLETIYRNGGRLHGVLYFHRISDRRMGGTTLRNFRVFQEICGDDFMKNVAIVSTMWEQVGEGTGSERERELENDFFKPALDKGAALCRHYNTTKSAQSLVRRLLNNPPKPLQIQIEIVDQKRPLYETSAGIVVQGELREQAERHREELEELRREIEEAAAIDDEQTRRELANEMQELQEQLARRERELQSFSGRVHRGRTGTLMSRRTRKALVAVLLLVPFAVLLRVVFPFLRSAPSFGRTWASSLLPYGRER